MCTHAHKLRAHTFLRKGHLIQHVDVDASSTTGWVAAHTTIPTTAVPVSTTTMLSCLTHHMQPHSMGSVYVLRLAVCMLNGSSPTHSRPP
jgi:hypothetical protein